MGPWPGEDEHHRLGDVFVGLDLVRDHDGGISRSIRELITTKDWTITLFLEVANAFEFPVYVMTK